MTRPEDRGRTDLLPPLLAWLVTLALAGVPGGVIAAPATPAATPAAVACDVAPRPVAEMVALLGTAPGGGGTPQPMKPLDLGTPADPATAGEIAAVVRALEACLNAGDQLRVYSLFADDRFRRMPRTTDVTGELAGLATLTPTPAAAGQRQRLIGPWFARLLPDGRAMAALLIAGEAGPPPDPIHTKAIFFARQDGRWMVEGLEEIVFVAECGGPSRVAGIVGPPPGEAFASWPARCEGAPPARLRRRDRQATPDAAG